jgi:hypothetical protein
MQTVYIIGNQGFIEPLNKELHDNSVFIRGQADVQVPGKQIQLYWIRNRSALREFKRAIGADLIWKYRLNFFFDLEKLVPETKTEEWSAEEKALMNKVRMAVL